MKNIKLTTLTKACQPSVSAKSNKKPKYSNTASSQCKRFLDALREKRGEGVSTFYSRNFLGIPHSGGRAMDLRKKGHEIITDWTLEEDANGVLHKIALYKLIREAVNHGA